MEISRNQETGKIQKTRQDASYRLQWKAGKAKSKKAEKGPDKGKSNQSKVTGIQRESKCQKKQRDLCHTNAHAGNLGVKSHKSSMHAVVPHNAHTGDLVVKGHKSSMFTSCFGTEVQKKMSLPRRTDLYVMP